MSLLVLPVKGRGSCVYPSVAGVLAEAEIALCFAAILPFDGRGFGCGFVRCLESFEVDPGLLQHGLTWNRFAIGRFVLYAVTMLNGHRPGLIC